MTQQKSQGLRLKKNVFRDSQDMLDTAQLFHRAGRIQEAEEIYRQILNQEPENAAATHAMGVIALQANQLDISEHFFNTAIILKGDDPVYYANLATVHFQRQELDKAKELLHQALGMDPAYADAHANLGVIYKLEDKLENARQHLVQAVNLGIREVDTILCLAQVNLALGWFERAENLAQSAYDIDPEQFIACEVMIEALCAQDRAFKALSWVEEISSKNPKHPRLQELSAMVSDQIGLPELTFVSGAVPSDHDADFRH